jgi:hypothetical protein
MTTSVTRLKALSRHPRMLLALPAAALGVTLTACGGGSAAHPAAPAPANSHAPSAPAHAAPAHTANPIPQGNGGDHDADNNGGPSDGDGNL